MLLFSGPALGNHPDDEPDHQDDEDYSDPDSGLEDVHDQVTTSQGNSRKEQKYEHGPRVCHRRPPSVVMGTLPFHCSSG